jgi:hypothetical protein
MNSYDRFAELWTDYLEGELDESGIIELQHLLQENAPLRDDAVLAYQLHRMLGLLAGASSTEPFVYETMQKLPSQSEVFVEKVLAQIESTATTCLPRPPLAPDRSRTAAFPITAWMTVLAATAAFAGVAAIAWKLSSSVAAASQNVKFANTAHSKFLGEFSPAVGAVTALNREYVLTSGSVHLAFPSGAEAIVEGPAVFQVPTTASLRMSKGKCSVHAPKGAEGFLVDTPNARIVDRGTRFAVSIGDSSNTEVHVVEGAADVYRPNELAIPNIKPLNEFGQGNSPSKSQVAVAGSIKGIRLNGNQARLFEGELGFAPIATPFKPRLYQSRLPDRIVSYKAILAANGGAEELVSVLVQRDGVLCDFACSELIGVELSSFRIQEKIFDKTNQQVRHLATRGPVQKNRLDVLSDSFLNTGAINPGGAVYPMKTDPIMEESRTLGESSPGFSIRFNKSVVNRPGPDVVFFELQDVAGAPDGDSFHVMPVHLEPGKNAITVKSYDLTLTSPETMKLANFFLHEFDEAVDSLSKLSEGSSHPLPSPQGGLGYRALAVAIDLSSMGFQNGELVDSLFFQDSMDDSDRVDPVFIGGLP